MIRLCAWCQQQMGHNGSGVKTELPITHGICNNCADNVVFQTGVSIKEFLDSFDAPIALINSDNKVQTANKAALDILQKEPKDVEGYRGGDVFECAYARLPGGCGRTVHCSGCTIRNTIVATAETGRNSLHTHAYLNRGDSDAPEKIDLIISTEKMGDMVLLRIDRVGPEITEKEEQSSDET